MTIVLLGGNHSGPARREGALDVVSEAQMTCGVPYGLRLVIFRRYLIFSAGAHLVWELLHLPLFSEWQAETPLGTALFLAHCILADVLVAASALMMAITLLQDRSWPLRSYGRVGLLAVVIGLAATVLFEWGAVHVLGLWKYSDLMPVVPFLDLGVSPVAQWLVIPSTGLWWAVRALPRQAD